MEIASERLTVARDEEFVVFLIGARVNRWWMLPVLWAVSSAMRRMMDELVADPEVGLMAYESFGGRTTLTLQYWRSVDHLLRYAADKERAHVPAWRQWIKNWGLGGAVGIWHETYMASPGSHEVVYQHMPTFGLGKVGPLVPAVGERNTARGRLGRLGSHKAA